MTPMLELRDIEAGYGDIKILWRVSLKVSQGEIVALIGPNGAGKSTTLRVIAGLVSPKTGQISLDGKNIGGCPAYEVARMGIALVPENRELFPRMTVQENLIMGAYSRSDTAHDTLEWIYAVFPTLLERSKQIVETLSGGEQQMLAIGRALMSKPRLLMLDEPSMGLSPIVAERTLESVAKLNDTGLTVLLVEQNITQALRMADRGYVLENGRIVLEGRARDLLEDPSVKVAYMGL